MGQEWKIIARIHSDFPSKFGIPRQSSLVPELRARIVFEPEYRNPDAVRGLEAFSHIWILWQFSETVREGWSPTVRPPRLGGNQRIGVFATRSPFRPNEIGLSSVHLTGIELSETLGPVLYVAGADLMDGTPIFDIKPYLPYADCHPDAAGGFTEQTADYHLKVELPDALRQQLTEQQTAALTGILAEDPRPAYQRNPERIYGFPYAGYEVRFQVKEGIARVLSLEKM